MSLLEEVTELAAKFEDNRPPQLVACPKCAVPIGYKRQGEVLLPRNANGTPHLCQMARMHYRAKFGLDKLEADRALYREWALVDLYEEYYCWQALLEELGVDALMGTDDDSVAWSVWDADNRILMLEDVIARRLFVMRRGLYRPAMDDEAAKDWRNWVSAARGYPMAQVVEDLEIEARGGQFTCPTQEKHGDGEDKHPSAWIKSRQNRFWCHACGNNGSNLDLLMQTGVAKSLMAAVQYMMAHYDLSNYVD